MEVKIKGHGGLFFWLQRVAEEHRTKAIDLIKQADLFHWQTVNFESMHEKAKEEVLKGMVTDMIELGWHKEVDELLKSRNNQQNEATKDPSND